MRGHSVVFTGFRDATLANKIRKAGGKYLDHITKACTVVVARDGMQATNKARMAAERGIYFMTLKQFQEATGLRGATAAADEDEEDA